MTYSFKVKNLFLCTVMVASINHASAAETGVMIDIIPTARFGVASHVSKDGSTIAGSFYNESWEQFIFTYDGSDITTAGSLGSDYGVGAISADGSIITGSFDAGGYYYHTFHYDGTDMADAASFGNQYTFPKAISDDGTVIVGSTRDTVENVFTYDGTAWIYS